LTWPAKLNGLCARISKPRSAAAARDAILSNAGSPL